MMISRSWAMSSLRSSGRRVSSARTWRPSSGLAHGQSRPVHGGLAVGGCIAGATHPLDGLRDLARSGQVMRALEGDVLHEVGEAGLGTDLRARTDQDVDGRRQRTHAWQPGGDDARPCRQRGSFEHRAAMLHGVWPDRRHVTGPLSPPGWAPLVCPRRPPARRLRPVAQPCPARSAPSGCSRAGPGRAAVPGWARPDRRPVVARSGG